MNTTTYEYLTQVLTEDGWTLALNHRFGADRLQAQGLPGAQRAVTRLKADLPDYEFRVVPFSPDAFHYGLAAIQFTADGYRFRPDYRSHTTWNPQLLTNATT